MIHNNHLRHSDAIQILRRPWSQPLQRHRLYASSAQQPNGLGQAIQLCKHGTMVLLLLCSEDSFGYYCLSHVHNSHLRQSGLARIRCCRICSRWLLRPLPSYVLLARYASQCCVGTGGGAYASMKSDCSTWDRPLVGRPARRVCFGGRSGRGRCCALRATAALGTLL